MDELLKNHPVFVGAVVGSIIGYFVAKCLDHTVGPYIPPPPPKDQDAMAWWRQKGFQA